MVGGKYQFVKKIVRFFRKNDKINSDNRKTKVEKCYYCFATYPSKRYPDEESWNEHLSEHLRDYIMDTKLTFLCEAEKRICLGGWIIVPSPDYFKYDPNGLRMRIARECVSVEHAVELIHKHGRHDGRYLYL